MAFSFRLMKPAAAVALFLMISAVLGCGSSSNGGGGSVTVSGGTTDVQMKNTAYNPADLTIDKGTTVRWVNDDSFAHTVTANDGKFDSGTVSAGGSFEYTFDEAGTFDYHCTIHSAMKGKITVR